MLKVPLMTHRCPECAAEVSDEAAVCPQCSRQIVGKPCPECAETVKLLAKRCRYCGHNFARDEKLASIQAYDVRASFLGTFLQRGRFIPERIVLTAEKVTIQSWGFLGMTRTDEEIPWEKIAGFHYHSGWFWDRVEIQTRGQHANSIGCLPKDEGARVKATLELMRE